MLNTEDDDDADDEEEEVPEDLTDLDPATQQYRIKVQMHIYAYIYAYIHTIYIHI